MWRASCGRTQSCPTPSTSVASAFLVLPCLRRCCLLKLLTFAFRFGTQFAAAASRCNANKHMRHARNDLLASNVGYQSAHGFSLLMEAIFHSALQDSFFPELFTGTASLLGSKRAACGVESQLCAKRCLQLKTGAPSLDVHFLVSDRANCTILKIETRSSS